MALYDSQDTEKTAPLDKLSASQLQEHGHTIVDEEGEQVLLYIVTAAENAAKAVADEVEEDAPKAGTWIKDEAEKAEAWVEEKAEAVKTKIKGKKKDAPKVDEPETSEPSNDGDQVAADETPSLEDADVPAVEAEEAPTEAPTEAQVEEGAPDNAGDGPANAKVAETGQGSVPTGL